MVDKNEVYSVLDTDMHNVEDFKARIKSFTAPYNITFFTDNEGENKTLTLTEWAFDQLMLKLKIPAAYIKRCPYSSEIDLQGKNVNYWINKNSAKRYLIRTKGLIIRAILSADDYTIVNNIGFFKFLIKNLTDSKTEKGPSIRKYNLNWKQFHVELVIDIVIDQQNSSIGIMAINSEVGYNAVVLHPMIYCENTSFISDVKYYQKHIYVDASSIFAGLSAKIAILLRKQPEIIEKFRESEHIRIDISEILEHLKLKYDIRKEEHTNIAMAINDAKNLKDVVAGLGKASEKTADLEREIELKKIGGKLLNRYTKEGVKRFVITEEV